MIFAKSIFTNPEMIEMSQDSRGFAPVSRKNVETLGPELRRSTLSFVMPRWRDLTGNGPSRVGNFEEGVIAPRKAPNGGTLPQ